MKQLRYIFAMLLMALVAMGAYAQTQRNRLYLSDITAQLGQIQLPVAIDNTDEIAALQFDLVLPDGMTVSGDIVATNRADGHEASIRNMGGKRYRMLLYSPENKPLRGQTGTVMYIPVTIEDQFDDGQQVTVTLEDATLSLATGEDVLTDMKGATITIAHLPDLLVQDIAIEQTELLPGEHLTVSWKVANTGDVATGGGWTERIALVAEDGTLTKLLATTYYDGVLDAEASVSRQADVLLPAALGIDGTCHVEVSIVTNEDTGESVASQANNTLLSEATVTIGKMLTLTLQPSRAVENETTRVAARLTRSGRWDLGQVFNLSATTDSRLSVPATVTIPASQSARVFYLDLTDNDVLDTDSIVHIAVEGNGYDAVEQQLTIEDNEYPDLKITASKSDIVEGETFQLTISTTRASIDPITVTLTSENAKRFSFPQTVTIAAGETSATVDVTAVDDELPSLDLSNAFTASAPKHNKAEVIVLLKDNDLPVLELQLTPTTVQESAGVVAVAGVLRRTTNTNSKITVKLTDDANGGLYFGNRTLVLDKGVEEVHFNFGPVDNAIVDGDRTYTVTAAVWLSSCSCGATGESAGYVEAQLQVLDNDGAALSLTSSLSTVKEGGKTTLTVTRNTTDTSKALTVTLSSDYEEGLTYNHVVIIPAGQQSATVEVTSAANSVQGDSHTVIFTVEAEDYAKGTCYMMVTDQTLPDARISSIAAVSVLDGSPVESLEVGGRVKLTITVNNDGAAELPAEVPVKIYLRGSSTAVGTVYTSEAIAVGEAQTVTKTITLPTTVGNHSYYAVVNESNTVQELTYNNNTSADVTITTVSPFAITVSTDKTIYMQGDKVTITGQLTGNSIAETDIDIYLINEGARQVQTVKTDANGAFTYEWQLFALQSGHFAIGACYPGEGLNTEMAIFDVYGLRRTEYSNITCDVINGDTHTGCIGIINPGQLNLTGCNVELLSLPETCEAQLSIPTTIAGGETVQLSYSLKGIAPTEENKWEEIKARVNTNEGVSLNVTLYFYCRNAQGKLVASTKSIVTTMTKGRTREYSIHVSNIGRGNTGKITLVLPDFIKSLAGNTLPGLEQNDTLTIPLSFTPTEEMQLNLPVTGQIGINCVNGEGVPVSFNITPVSGETGTLVVDVCDEYTYYTDEAPHVENAEVVVRNPVTNILVTQGRTNCDGIFSVVLPEGYYKLSVTANNHDSYTNNVYVDPEIETRKVINLSTQAITVDWKVEETEVEDEYEIVTTVKFETNVPEPVVELVVPKSLDIDSLGVGESIIFNAVLTNKGLITALDAELLLPEGFSRISFEPLAQYKGLTIAPQQSVFIPVKVTRVLPVSTSRRRLPDIDNDPCVGQPGTLYFWDCGEDRKWHRYGIAMQLGSCKSDDPSTWDNSGNGYGGREWTGGWPDGIVINFPPNLPGGSTFGSSFYQGLPGIDEGCEPCQNRFLYKMVKCITGRIPVFKEFWDIIDWVEEPIEKGADELRDKALDRLEDGAKRLKPVYGLVKRFIKYLDIWGDCIKPLYEPCDPGNFNGSRAFAKKANGDDNNPSYIQEYQEVLSTLTSAFDAEIERTLELFGDSAWIYCDDEELSSFIDVFVKYAKEEVGIDSLNEHKPQGISNNNLALFIERWNNTITGSSSANKIDIEKYDELGRTINSVIQYAIDNGYLSMMEMYEEAEERVISKLNDASKSVCATITLQFKQTMVMTRQAFRGTLTVFNGNETSAMENVKLILNVSNRSTGLVATAHEFQINAESLEGFSGQLDLGSGWTLDANATGTATVLFIPTKYAAPEEQVEWSFGGTLSYIDPFTGLEVTRELYPVTLTVKPCPELDLTYFMQRDVYGDDALTLDVVEPMKPAEFALMINNKGYGDATNVRMVTQQPEIIENEKGLYIDFELISSQVNGGDAALSFGQSIANDFGTIPAHSQMYAQWWLTSTLLGHFTDYKVEATHVTSYGNEDLSLLDQVTIHELIHGFDMPEGSLVGGPEKGRAFLVNDIADANDLPDKLYFSNGEIADVEQTTVATIERTSSTTCLLTITPTATGWNYGSLLDPTHGYAELKSIVRQSDGKELGSTRFWQTDRTLRDGKDWLYENRLHFVDEFASGGAQTYVLTFDPVPDEFLAVTSIAPVPEEGTIAEEDIKTLTVTFNKEVYASTFTGDDITFNVQGVKQDAGQIGISTKDNKNFTLDLSALNEQCPNGYYTLTVQTADITDTEGFQGKTGKQVGWILFRGGLVQLQTSAYPKNSGSVMRKPNDEVGTRGLAPVEHDTNTAKYGSLVTLVADPAEGYEFANWTLNGEVVSTDAEFTTTALGDMDVVANFVKKKYMVNIASTDETMGTVSGTGTGIYEHGTSIELTAVPAYDYAFKEWLVDGAAITSPSTLSLTVDKELDVKASFLREYYYQTLRLARGWNWVSGYLQEPIDLAMIANGSNRILSQTDELIRDPQLGMVGPLQSLQPAESYKVQAASSFNCTFRGHLFDVAQSGLSLEKGWNWMGYPSSENQPVSAIANAEDGDCIVAQEGFSQYDGSSWEGTVAELTPGQGYLYKSASTKQLQFDFTETPAGSRMATSHLSPLTSHLSSAVDPHQYPSTMNITARIYRDGMELPGSQYTVYAYAGNELRGVSQFVGSNHYLTVYGDEPVVISFIVESAETGETFAAAETLTFVSDVVGSRKSPYAVSISTTTGISQQMTDTPMAIYTLDGILVSRDATIRTLHTLPKGVYIVNGRKTVVK